MRAFLAGAMLVGALGCGQVEENPFEPDGSNPDPVGAALVFSGDQVSWRSTTPGLPRLQVALPGERTSVYAWPPKESPPDTAGVLELLAWPEDTQDSLDLALFIEDDAGHDLLVLSERVSSQGQREPDVGSCLRATMIDVGWGDAHLLEAPSGRRLLIDTGSWDNQSQLRTFLGDRLTSTSPEGHLIDDLVLTHLHADHVSGFEATVTYDYDVGTVYFSSPYYEYGYGYTYERLRSKALDSGAEVLEPWENINFSRSFLFGYAIHRTHTGAYATLQVTDMIALTGGAVVGWDNVQDNNRSASGIGQLAIRPNQKFRLYISGILGPEQTCLPNRGAVPPLSGLGCNSNNRGVVDVVIGMTPLPGLDFTLNYDFGSESGASVRKPGAHATWSGFSGIASYTYNRWQAGLRGEWFQDGQGARTSVPQTLWAVSLDARVFLSESLYLRSEYRHDESNQSVFVGDSPNQLFRGQDTIAIEIGYSL